MRNRKDNENKIRILKSAEQLFYEHGYIDTYVNEIIELAETSKGTFYHYYENKIDLGGEIYESIITQVNTKIITFKPIFKEEGELIWNLLSVMVFWNIFFFNEHIRLFINEINMESYQIKLDPLMEYCIKEQSSHFNRQELNLTLAAIQGMRRENTIQLYHNIHDYDAITVSDFVLRKIMQHFNFTKKTIRDSLKCARELYDQLYIDNDKFHINISLKKSTE